MATLNIIEPKKNSKLFGTIQVIAILADCPGPVNDWEMSISGCDFAQCEEEFGVDFLYSSFPPDPECLSEICDYKLCDVPENSCIVVFNWDTTKCLDGIHTLTITGGGHTSYPLELEVKNLQSSYRILNKKLLNSKVTIVDPPKIELEVSEEVKELIESLPGGVLVDMEVGSNERFTVPINGPIIGEELVERILDLRGAEIQKVGDTLFITVPPDSAWYYNKEFAGADPKVQVGQIDSTNILEADIETIDPQVYPATHSEVFEGE